MDGWLAGRLGSARLPTIGGSVDVGRDTQRLEQSKTSRRSEIKFRST